MKIKIFTLLFALLAPCFFVSCNDKKEDEIEVLKKGALVQYAYLVWANYEDSYQTAITLKQAIDAFLANPTEAGFEACKTAWLNARNPYGQTEAFRFYAGPIDDADGPEGLMNAWPMDENYIDYVVNDPSAGVINNPAALPTINKEVLVGLNELFSSEVAVFTGWHAIEFLLWGQDLSTNGPGARPFTDYVTDGSGTAANQDRRGQYLQVAVDLLIEHLAQVRDEWKPGGAYREEFLTEKTSGEAMGLIFFGLREFTKTELAGERMFVAIDTQDQEHEHSCFADNTIADLVMNLEGIKNVYFGVYVGTDGAISTGESFHDIVERIDPAKAEAVQVAMADAEAALNAIPAPFDQSITQNTATIAAAITVLETLGDRLEAAGKAIGAEF